MCTIKIPVYLHSPFEIFVGNDAGSMSYSSLMNPRGVAAGVWPDITSGAGRALANTMEKARVVECQVLS